jgi:hypothetical protein
VFFVAGSEGIGTTTPTQTLDVNGTARIENLPANSDDNLVTADASGDLSVRSASALLGILTASNGVTRNANDFELGSALTGNTDIPLAGNNLTFSGTGNVGIGMTAPAQPLDVSGNVQFSGALMPNSNAGSSGQVLVSNGTNTAPTWQNAATLNMSKIASSQATAPTLSTNDGANISGLTLSSDATDAAGMITFTTDGGETGGDYVELDFNANTTQPAVQLTPANDQAGSFAIPIGIYAIATGGAPGNFRITLGSNWPGLAGTYKFYYHVIDTQ